MIKKILSRNIKTKIHIPFHIIKDTIPHGINNKNICPCPMFCASPKQHQDTNPIISTRSIGKQGKSSLHMLSNDPCQDKLMPSLHCSTSSNPPHKSPILSNNFHKNKYTQASIVSINEVSPIRTIVESIGIKMYPNHETLVHVSHSKILTLLTIIHFHLPNSSFFIINQS